jgi:hypothetical protein
VTRKWASKFENRANNTEFRLRYLRERHSREIAALSERDRDPIVLKKLCRPSRELLALRRAERKLAASKEYSEARRTKAMADELQRREEAQMQAVIEREIQSEFGKLTTAHRKELERFIAHDKKAREELEAQRRREIEPLECSLRQIDVKRDEPINTRLMAMQLVSAPSCGRCDEGTRSRTLRTPRAAEDSEIPRPEARRARREAGQRLSIQQARGARETHEVAQTDKAKCE